MNPAVHHPEMTEESKTGQPYAELWIRALAAVIEALIFMALSLPFAFALAALVNKQESSAVLPQVPALFFLEGLVPLISFPFFLNELSKHLQATASNTPIASTTLVWVFTVGVLLTVNTLYHALMESSKFQGTIGKIVVGLKVTNINGERISFFAALLRHFGRILSMIPLFAGYFIMVKMARKQTFHDTISRSTVVKTPPEEDQDD